jgi:hypothetical protein
VVLTPGGESRYSRTVYAASGAEEYTRRLAAEPEALAERLLAAETYRRMRFLLEEVEITADLEAGGE